MCRDECLRDRWCRAHSEARHGRTIRMLREGVWGRVAWLSSGLQASARSYGSEIIMLKLARPIALARPVRTRWAFGSSSQVRVCVNHTRFVRLLEPATQMTCEIGPRPEKGSDKVCVRSDDRSHEMLYVDSFVADVWRLRCADSGLIGGRSAVVLHSTVAVLPERSSSPSPKTGSFRGRRDVEDETTQGWRRYARWAGVAGAQKLHMNS